MSLEPLLNLTEDELQLTGPTFTNMETFRCDFQQQQKIQFLWLCKNYQLYLKKKINRPSSRFKSKILVELEKF